MKVYLAQEINNAASRVCSTLEKAQEACKELLSDGTPDDWSNWRWRQVDKTTWHFEFQWNVKEEARYKRHSIEKYGKYIPTGERMGKWNWEAFVKEYTIDDPKPVKR